MRLKTHIYRLHNSFVFRIAHGSRSSIDTFFVRLQADGLEGVGEATPVPYYGMTPQKMEELLEMHRERIETAVWTSPEDLWQQLDPFLHENRFAQCALDIAAHDLFAQKQGKPLYASWGLSLDTVPLSNYTIGIDEIDQMVQKMKEVDFPIYKIKLGTENDLAIVEALRKHSNAVFRVDANCSWTVEQTIEYAPELKKLGVEFIEQPLPANQMAENGGGLCQVCFARYCRRKLYSGTRCFGLRREIPWRKYQISQMWWTHSCTAYDSPSKRLWNENHVRLHDRKQRRYFGYCATIAPLRLCRYGWRFAHRQ
jgi:L-alanine-DL-glutamate epimerase-like enolase superfamily enzyme